MLDLIGICCDQAGIFLTSYHAIIPPPFTSIQENVDVISSLLIFKGFFKCKYGGAIADPGAAAQLQNTPSRLFLHLSPLEGPAGNKKEQFT